MSEPPLRAIPTTYTKTDGSTVHLKSRLEAFVAWLLDLCGHEWEYEPQSFLLANGVNYQPDFWLPDARTWVEARGYDSTAGRKQIRGFADRLLGDALFSGERPADGDDTAYLVIGPREFLHVTRGGSILQPWSYLAVCESVWGSQYYPQLALNTMEQKYIEVGAASWPSYVGPQAAVLQVSEGRLSLVYGRVEREDGERTNDFNELMELIEASLACVEATA